MPLITYTNEMQTANVCKTDFAKYLIAIKFVIGVQYSEMSPTVHLVTLRRLVLLLFCVVPGLGRQQRGLPLFFGPTGGVLNFVCGFGIPVENLDYETVLSGIVFKSQHFLPAKPENLMDLHTTKINGRNFITQSGNITTGNTIYSHHFQKLFNIRAADLSTYRWILYHALEQLTDNTSKYPPRACLLRSICEASAVPLETDESLLAEILHIILTPSLSKDTMVNHMNVQYLAAEQLGRNGDDCASIFHECTKSFLSEFTKILH